MPCKKRPGKSPALEIPDPEGDTKGSGSFEGILGGEILVAEIMGDSLMIDMPCVYVQTIGEMRVAR